MTTSPGWVHGRITELDRAECLELLMSRSVGRVGFGTADGPLVLPVNFVPYDGGVLFRTSPHNSIAQNLNGKPACFEVDEIDDFTESGWSVLVRGTAAFVDDPATLPRDERPVPWAEGTRSLFVHVPGTSVTGRRLFPG